MVYVPIDLIVILILNVPPDKIAKKMDPVVSGLVKAVSLMPTAREWAMSALLKDETPYVVVAEPMKTVAWSFAVRNQAIRQFALSEPDVLLTANA